MSWLEQLGAFAIGFAQGFSQQCAVQGRASAGAHHASYDFQSLMYALAEASGLRLLRVRQRSASFALSADGKERLAVVIVTGEMIELSVCSAITFPSGRAPMDVARGLARKNEELSGCKFDLVEGDDGAFFTFDTTIGAGSLTPAFFVSALREMVPCIASFDRLLLENGYAR